MDNFSPLTLGAIGGYVKIVQEWLTLNGADIAIDSQYGPITREAVSEYQAKIGCAPTGIVDESTFLLLQRPLVMASAAVALEGKTLRQVIAAIAKQHLAQKPREIGGDNRGPWVRFYMDGHDGSQWPWCAGFATKILNQVFGALNATSPVTRTFGCDMIGDEARKKGSLIHPPTTDQRPAIGDLFLVPRGSYHYQHVGIVLDLDENHDYFYSAEGNSNTDGSPNGYEAVSLRRPIYTKDFVSLGVPA